jgi:hypothetical protein
MAADYVFLLSSLPMLLFGARPPFSFEVFIEKCRGLISDEDLAWVGKTQGNDPGPVVQPTLAAYLHFEIVIRNELVRGRAARLKIDPAKYMRPDGYAEPSMAHLAQNAFRAGSLLEGERLLDQARWEHAESLKLGHYFDLDALIVYAIHLRILERWERIRTADKASAIAEALEV